MSATQSTGTFTQIDRDCLVTLMDEGLSGDAAMAFLALLTSRRAPHIGLVSGIGSAVPVMSEDRLTAALAELQMAGKIAYDERRDEVIIRSWFRRNTFGRPKRSAPRQPLSIG